jgi:soluble cytochrome b562
MIDYVQAGRQLEKFKKVKEFKELLKQSALGFEATQELDGIEQCLKVAKKLVRSKRKTNLKSLDAGELDNAKENQAFVAEIREIYHRLRDS